MADGMSWLKDGAGRWVVGVDCGVGISFLGLDSEGGGRVERNLLRGAVRLAYEGLAADAGEWVCGKDKVFEVTVGGGDVADV